jgi:hypothetical protein
VTVIGEPDSVAAGRTSDVGVARSLAELALGAYVANRGGLPQDPEASLPALYIAGRDLNPQPGTGTFEPSGPPLRTTARLTMRCS